jgi:hypothetical protein
MNSTRRFNRLLFCALLASAANAQDAFVNLNASVSRVIAGAKLTLGVSFTDSAGTPMDATGLVWVSSNPAFGAVDSTGVVSGLIPGDTTVTVKDSGSGASDSVLIHVLPSAIVMQPPFIEFAAGSTASLTAQALDVNGKAIAGVQFQYQSGEPSVADVTADGTVNAISEGFVTIQARVAAATGDPALFATIPVHVLRAPGYKIKKILSSETSANTTILSYSSISAAGANEIAAIATLANGSQAAVLIENNKPKVLAVTGRLLPNARRMVIRIDEIAANSKGDVAMRIEYPGACSQSIILIPHGQPEQEISGSYCYYAIYQRALGEDGNLLFAYNSQVFKADGKSAPKLVFSLAAQPALNDPIRNLNDMIPSRAGTMILNTTTASGVHQYFHYDGKTLTPVYKDGDTIGSSKTTNLGTIVGGTDGKFYCSFYGNGFSGLAQLAPGPVKSLIRSGDTIPGGNFGWAGFVADAGPAGVLFETDLSLPPNYNSWMSIWDGTSLKPQKLLAGGGGLLAGAMLPSGAAIATAILSDDASLAPLRSFTAGSDPVVLEPAGQPLSEPVPASIDWRYASRGGMGTAFPVRGAGDAVMKTGDSPQTVVSVGSPLPNKTIATWVGAVMANESGDTLFSASFANGSGIFRTRGGSIETLADNLTLNHGPSSITFNWVDTWRGRYLALNNRGDAVAIVTYNSAKRLIFYAAGGQQTHITQQNVNGQTGFFNSLNAVAIDDDGHVMFLANDSANVAGAYYWDGVHPYQKVFANGDAAPTGLKFNEMSNIAGAGHGFVIMTASGGYANRELRTYDGAHLNLVQSTDYTLFDGFGFSGYGYNECTLAVNGDAHCLANTQDGGSGVFAHRASGADVVVARTRDRFPGGEWMITPLTVSSAANGDLYFTAYMYKDGAYFLALYQAALQ